MRLKTYRASSMAAAMTQLRSELGPDALILGARNLKDGVELTGGIDPGETGRPAPATVRAVAPAAARAPVWPPAMPRPNEAAMRAIAAHHSIPEALCHRMTAPTLIESLKAVIRFGSIAVAEGPLLFVGPPGAGKTSTVARLATRLVLAGEQPMVITADGRRAGATEQLAAYTRLLGVNLVVATHPLALGRAMARREPGSPVLIDAPGCGVHDPLQMQEMAALAAVADARLALVLPAGLDSREAADIAEVHAAIGATLLISTRLDLARRLGSVLAAAAGGPLALVEAGIGPGAADGLVPLTPVLLAERLQSGLPPMFRQSISLNEALAC